MSRTFANRRELKQQQEALARQLADLLLSSDSPVKDHPAFETLWKKNQALLARQNSLCDLERRIVSVLPSIEQAEGKFFETRRSLKVEVNKIPAYAAELGRAAFAALQAGEIADQSSFAIRRRLQSRIDSLIQQKSRLDPKNAKLTEKVKAQVNLMLTAAQVKIEEMRVSSTDRTVGESLLASGDEESVRCERTDGILRAITIRRQAIAAAKDSVEQTESSLVQTKSAAAKTLDRDSIPNAAFLRAELKGVQKEIRGNQKSIVSARQNAVVTALSIERFCDDIGLQAHIKQMRTIQSDLDSSRPRALKLIDPFLERWKQLPTRVRYGACGAVGVVLLIVMIGLIVREQGDASAQFTSKSTGMKLVLIPAGTFQMGSSAADVREALQADLTLEEKYFKSEQPQHSVRISRPFYMGVTEVTQEEYEKVMGANPSGFSKTGHGKEALSGQETSKFPVEWVSWYDAIEFCNKLSAQDGFPAYYTMTNAQREYGSIKSATVSVSPSALPPGQGGYRLPTEAEWEYACRANTTTPFSFGNVLNGDKANVNGDYPFGTTMKGKSLGRTTTVGSYGTNAFGLSDMHGNVFEWCFDVYEQSAYGKRSGTSSDPTVTSGSKYRVLRGGSWHLYAKHSRSASRRYDSEDRLFDIGFRVVLPSKTKPSIPSEPPKPDVSASRGFEGTKAGDAKELVPGIAFRWCPAGTFTMGTPGATISESLAEVTLTSGFWLGETEVTQGQWQKLMGTSPWRFMSYVKEGSDFAASYIRHDDAVSYCQKLTTQERSAGRLPSGWKYTLPTEAQWEHACRAGTTTGFSFGEDESKLGEYSWFDKNASDIGEKYSHQVGKKKPNAWGLLDMHGNVWEWCGDWYGSKLPGGRDPQGPSTGSNRLIRGGGWNGSAVGCRSATRLFDSPVNLDSILGFRLAAVPE